jgi:hypothetical protein
MIMKSATFVERQNKCSRSSPSLRRTSGHGSTKTGATSGATQIKIAPTATIAAHSAGCALQALTGAQIAGFLSQKGSSSMWCCCRSDGLRRSSLSRRFIFSRSRCDRSDAARHRREPGRPAAGRRRSRCPAPPARAPQKPRRGRPRSDRRRTREDGRADWRLAPSSRPGKARERAALLFTSPGKPPYPA